MRIIDTDDTENRLAAGLDNTASDAVALPSETPRLAILPLRNINGDDSQNYFSDGLTEDLITDLSRVSGLTVISSTTSFAYKDSTDNPGAIASQLNVDYLLLGSVQRDSNRVRISMRLVDAKTDSYHWTARYEHHMQDIFQLQDQVVRELVDALSVTLTKSEHALITETTEVDPQAYDLLLQGLSPLREFSVAGIERSRQLFLKALEIEPDYARAHANLALGYGREVVFRLAEYQPELIRKGLAEAQLAEDLDNTIPQTEFARGVLHLADRNHQAAVKASERAIELDPEYADGFALLAQTTAYSGRLNQALQAIRRAKSLNPRYPFSYLWVEGHILYLLNQFDEALPLLEESNERNPTFLLGLLTLTATYAQLEQFEDADWINQEILSLVPDFSSHQEGIQAPYKLAKHRELYIDGLLKAGLPD
jgi:TolB-like protein